MTKRQIDPCLVCGRREVGSKPGLCREHSARPFPFSRRQLAQAVKQLRESNKHLFPS